MKFILKIVVAYFIMQTVIKPSYIHALLEEIPFVVFALLAIILAVLAFLYNQPLLHFLSLALFFIALIFALKQLIYVIFTKLIIDEDYITLVEGFINKEVKRVPKSKIVEIKKTQSLVGRVIGSWEIYIDTAGSEGYEIEMKYLERDEIEKI